MIDIVFSMPEGLNKKGKLKWESEVTHAWPWHGRKDDVLLGYKLPDLNFNHFKSHQYYSDFVVNKEKWNDYSVFFSGISSIEALELFFDVNENGSVVQENVNGMFIRNLLEQLNSMNNKLASCESEIEDLKNSVRSLEWDASGS
jgi:hypothetical protein